MLKELMKAAGLAPAKAEAAKPVQHLEVKVDTTEIQAMIAEAVAGLTAEFNAYKQTAEELAAHEQSVITALAGELDATKALLTEAQTALAAAQGATASLVEDAEAKRLNARKERVVAAIGTEKSEGLLKATENLDDAAFDAVVSALGVSAAIEAKSPMFKEVGVAAETDATVVVESAEMRLLKAKYGKK